jgi:aspartyl-tRNA(Asn)/glutamyl-tRNA(Gln) amidotransferase subunit B
VQRALEYEIARQTEILEGGGRVVQETRLWDTDTGATVSMRSKEEAHDYRYFPEPDLPPLQLDPGWIEQIRASLPELPDARRKRFVEQYGLPEYDAGVLTQAGDVADYFEAAAAAAGNPKAASNWVMGELMRKANETGVALTALPMAPAALAGLIRLVDAGTITSPVAKEVFETMIATGRPADAIVAAEGLARIDDESAIASAVRQVIEANADAVAQYRAGKQQTFGFLVGQVMKATRGKANPARVNELMRRLLDQA